MKLHAGMQMNVPDIGFSTVDFHLARGLNFFNAFGLGITKLYLPEDRKTAVPDNGGWEGNRYRHEFDSGATLEAWLYSNNGGLHQGQRFSDKYTLDQESMWLDPNLENVWQLITLPSHLEGGGNFAQSLGSNGNFVLPGTFHGVQGNFKCWVNAANVCAIRVDMLDGYHRLRLGAFNTDTDVFDATNQQAQGNYWTFEPHDSNDRLPDDSWNLYGWWLHKSADGENYVAAAAPIFAGVQNLPDTQSLTGTATYSGGAAGLYAFDNEGGDTGSFTARARLTADFDGNEVKGTIDRFTGRDGRPRDWSVELEVQGFEDDNGNIYGDDGTTGSIKGTKWTIGGVVGDGGGKWSGAFTAESSRGPPTTVVGSFTAVQGTEGRMVGSFGADRQ